MTNAKTITTTIDSDGIVLLTLNRPERLNAFTLEMADELEAFFIAANFDDATRAIIVTGAGRAFCAGMDLGTDGDPFGLDYTLDPTLDDLRNRSGDPAIRKGVRDTGGRVSLAIANCLKPVIAAINGVAVGVGATMTLPMDLRIASTTARIGFVFGKIGIVPEACSSWFLPRIVGLTTALEWAYTADIVDASKACDSGLFKAVVEPDALIETARDWARRFTRDRSPAAVALTRQMMMRNSAFADPLPAHHIESLAVFHVAQRDGREGVQAFREKRSPHFEALASTGLPDVSAWWSGSDGSSR